MLDDRIGMGDIELTIGKPQAGAVTIDRANSRVTPIEFRNVCANACARRGAIQRRAGAASVRPTGDRGGALSRACSVALSAFGELGSAKDAGQH